MSFFTCAVILFSSVQVFAGADFLGPYGAYGNKISNPENWIAIIGDSGVTGAASSPEIEPTVSNLWGHFSQVIWGNPASATAQEGAGTKEHPLRFASDLPTRVPYSQGEYKEHGWFGHMGLNFGARLAMKLDVLENSFGYQVGRKLGVRASDIVFVGQDGVMVKTIGDQFARIFEMHTKTLPPLVLISFTANDLCDVHVFDFSPEEWAAKFGESLRKAWADAKPYLIAHAKGTRILVLAPFDVVNVITNEEVLAQMTNVEGQGRISCGQLRHGETHLTASSWLIMRMLNLMCPSVTKTHPGDLDHLDHLRAVQHEFGEVWKKQLGTLSADYPGIQFSYLEGVRDIKFTTGDVGNDCFHPSAAGHAKLADYILHSQALE